MFYDFSDKLTREEQKNLNDFNKSRGVKYHGNSWLFETAQYVVLYSYATTICVYDKWNTDLFFNCEAFDYSRTTVRHISNFCRDYLESYVDYYDLKHLILNEVLAVNTMNGLTVCRGTAKFVEDMAHSAHLQG